MASLPRRTDQLHRRWKRTRRVALLASLALHVVAVLLFRQARPLPDPDYAAADETPGADGAPLGGGMQAVALSIETPASAMPEPEPVVTPPVAEPVVRPRPQPTGPRPPTTDRADGSGSSGGQGQGTGTGTGEGTGSGGGTGSGTGGDAGAVTAPSPRGLILPPTDRPADVRGRTVTVHVFVNERGRVVPDSTRLSPSTGDRGFDNRLKQKAGEWSFRPATRGGVPIAAWFPFTITL